MTQSRPPLIHLTFYTRPDCPLCDRLRTLMQPILERHQKEDRLSINLRFVDITTDSDLQKRYGIRIPVVTHQQKILFEGRPDRTTVEAALQSLLMI